MKIRMTAIEVLHIVAVVVLAATGTAEGKRTIERVASAVTTTKSEQCNFCVDPKVVTIPEAIITVPEIRDKSTTCGKWDTKVRDSTVAGSKKCKMYQTRERIKKTCGCKKVAAVSCFDTKKELRDSVIRYKNGDEVVRAKYGNVIGDWCVDRITDFSFAFQHLDYSPDISKWNVSAATNMSNMFQGAFGFNSSIGKWDVSRVTDMSNMFNSAIHFNEDLSRWDVSNVITMKTMFLHAKSFNRNIDKWNVSKVSDMSYMFFLAKAFNQDLLGWDVSNVNMMRGMFAHALDFNGQIGTWMVSKVTNMEGMFEYASKFNQSLCSWKDRIKCSTNMDSMFDVTNCPEWNTRRDGTPECLVGPFCTKC